MHMIILHNVAVYVLSPSKAETTVSWVSLSTTFFQILVTTQGISRKITT
jgi:hypothetical protein